MRPDVRCHAAAEPGLGLLGPCACEGRIPAGPVPSTCIVQNTHVCTPQGFSLALWRWIWSFLCSSPYTQIWQQQYAAELTPPPPTHTPHTNDATMLWHLATPPPPAGERGVAQSGPSFPVPRSTWARSITAKSDVMQAPPPTEGSESDFSTEISGQEYRNTVMQVQPAQWGV